MTSTKAWTEVDQYFMSKLQVSDPLMDSVLKANSEAELPAIDVSPNQGKFLSLLAQLKGAKRILEIGTLGGYSTIWLARALPEDGHLVTLEYSEKHAKVAAKNIQKAGMDQKVEIKVGAALDTLPTIEGEFDFIFIDADKQNNANYLKWALELSQPGAVIITDNVVRGGRVIEDNTGDESVQGVRYFVDMLSEESRIDSTVVQTVGSKGYDGFVMGIVKG
ncbi:O-methyltransferase [Rossellomorea aquimaris]|uniref:Putative O-methyltransferase YrrM n=1 Tax=Rossellomorea aquimaris TaxID=189382 RepID=A0A366F1D0_9BACI|nr:O-methyltransferase [Rossellomorea aquimaris]RBP07790.1 putative O-methyltransferase YrrM [Rossellomorea aquimaris]